MLNAHVPVNIVQCYTSKNMKSETKYNLIVTTTAKKEEAVSIARSLVSERLVACAQIISNIESYYWWQGDVCQDNEFQILLKSETRLNEKIFLRIKELHSYEVSEIISIPIQNGSGEYLDWISASVD